VYCLDWEDLQGAGQMAGDEQHVSHRWFVVAVMIVDAQLI
jgi:hypothetical protein